MHNLFINQLRSAPPASVQFDEMVDTGHAEDASIAIDLERALAWLPDDQREVLLMVTVEDFTYGEVARVGCGPAETANAHRLFLKKSLDRMIACTYSHGYENPFVF